MLYSFCASFVILIDTFSARLSKRFIIDLILERTKATSVHVLHLSKDAISLPLAISSDSNWKIIGVAHRGISCLIKKSTRISSSVCPTSYTDSRYSNDLRSHAITTPANRRGKWLVCFWDDKILLRYIHLCMCSEWFLRIYFALFHEVKERRYEVFTEIKIIMVHVRWHNQGTWSSTLLMQFFWVLKRNQVIFHSVHKKGRTSYFWNFLNIIEPILYEVFQYTTRLVFCNASDWFERAHHKQTTRVSFAGHMCCWTTSHASPKNDHVLLFDA